MQGSSFNLQDVSEKYTKPISRWPALEIYPTHAMDDDVTSTYESSRSCAAIIINAAGPGHRLSWRLATRRRLSSWSNGRSPGIFGLSRPIGRACQANISVDRLQHIVQASGDACSCRLAEACQITVIGLKWLMSRQSRLELLVPCDVRLAGLAAKVTSRWELMCCSWAQYTILLLSTCGLPCVRCKQGCNGIITHF